jgi:replicative DNA helicase
LRGIPVGVFKLRDQEAQWIYDFRADYNQYPTPVAFRQHFKIRLKRPRDPLAAVLQPVLDREQYDSIRTIFSETKQDIDSGLKIPEVIAKYRARNEMLKSFEINYSQASRQDSEAALKYYEERVRMSMQGGLITSPWPTLNKMIGTFLPEEVFISAARTNMGKTWKLLWWSHHLAKMQIETLVASFEMSKTEIELRDESILYKLPYDDIRNGTLSPKLLARWRRQRKTPKPYRLEVIAPATGSKNDLAIVEQAAEQSRSRVIFIDAAYKMNLPSFHRNMNETVRLAEISRQIKSMAKRLKVFVIVILQMGRKAESAKGSKANITDIYGSDAWSQDADYLEDTSGVRGSNSRKNSLLKSRNSSIGDYFMNFQIDPFVDLSEKAAKLGGNHIPGSDDEFHTHG